MGVKLNFIDGTFIIGYDPKVYDTRDGFSMNFPNCIIVINKDDNRTPNFVKKDFDGNEWSWNGSRLTVSGPTANFFVTIDTDYIAYLSPYMATLSEWSGEYSFVTSRFNITTTSNHTFLGYNGVANGTTVGQWISTYTDHYRAINALSNYSIQYELLNSDLPQDSTYNQVFSYAGGTGLDLFALFPNSVEEYTPSTGPYQPGGPSGPGTLPPGTFDDTSDPIPDSPLPTLSAADTGFTRIYNPTLSQVQALARYLWTEPSIIDTIWNHIKQFFEDPMQAIIGFNLVPCAVPDGGTRNFSLMFIDTGVQMTAAASQFVDVDCGTLTLDRYYGSALDQNPYTKVSCFLPYIGTVHLNTDEVMGTTLQVKYRIDIVSGSCVAKIFVDGSVLYQYSGHCAINIPVSSADFSSYVSAAITVGTALAGMAVGAAAGGAVGAEAGVVQSTGVSVASESTALAPASSGAISTIGQHEFAAQQLAYMSSNPPPSGGSTQASFSGLDPKNIVNTVGQTMGGKMQVEHSGAFSGNSGYLGVRRPFVIIERPNMCLPSIYGQLNGYPSMITLNLGECTGFTKVQQVQLTGCTATNPEQSEILQFLKSGVIL